MSETDPRPTFYLIPHTHWEGAVFQTRKAYLDLGLPNILRALALLKVYPDYRFTLDQVCYVKPFLERYPQEADAFRRFVAEGRLAIVGGTDCMPDVNMPGGEAFVRQVLYGKRYFREALGAEVTVGWQLDTFGHHAQMPQLLKLAGLRSFWFFRGVPDWETPPEFLWEGLDGSRIRALWLPLGYAVSYDSPETPAEFSRFMQDRYDELGRFYAGPLRPGPGGADVCAPEEHLPELVAEHDSLSESPLRLRLATPAEYEAAAPLPDEAPVLRGELNPIFQGIYSSRIGLKQSTRRIESLLLTAEKLGVLLQAAGRQVSDEVLWEAWERVLFNHAHDLMSGVMTDAVYEDTLRSYDFSRRLAEGAVAARLRDYCATLDTRGDGVALVVFNALGSPRTDVVIATVGFSEPDVEAVRVVDSAGTTVAAQLLRAERHVNGGLVEIEVAFVAESVPALGHCVYRVVPTAAGDPAAALEATPLTSGLLETELYRLQVDPHTGAIVHLQETGQADEILAGPANLVVQEPDRGDFWEPYRPLDGGSRIAMNEPHPMPPRGQAVYSDEQAGAAGTGLCGPVLSEFTVEHGFGEQGEFATTVRVFSGLRRIEIRTRLLNNDEFVRYRVLLPTNLPQGRLRHEIPFGCSERSAGVEFPAQNWVDWSDGRRGLALLNRGLPGNAVSDGTLLLSLLRSTRIVAYGFGGGYGPGMSSDSGLELGQEHVFEYALLPHGSEGEVDLTREGLEYNNPLIAVTAASHAGARPPRWGLVEIDPPEVTLSATKLSGEGTAVLRVYEPSGEARPHVTVRLTAGAQWLEEANLLEDVLGELDSTGATAHFALGAFEIKTLRVRLAGSGQG